MDTKTDRDAWLANLKPGDDFAIMSSGRFYRTTYRLGKVERVTPTQIVEVSGRKYRRDNGRPTGERFGCAIEPMTPAIAATNQAARDENEARGIVEELLSRLRRENMSHSDLSVMVAALRSLHESLTKDPA